MTVDLNIRDLAHDIASRAAEADRIGKLPAQDIQALRDSGYLTLNIPRELGGYGLDMRDCMAAHLELSQGSTSTALVAAMQLQIFGQAGELRHWPAGKYEEFCQAAVDGGLFNHLATEPALGSPSRGGMFMTSATPIDGGWLVNGHKTWATGGRHLTHLLIRLSMDDGAAEVLIYPDLPGVEWVETWGDGLSLRASDSHDVYFHDVAIPSDQLLSRQNDKTPGPKNAWFAMTLAATYLGTASAARNAVIQYALERVPSALGKPIATLPTIQRQIGELDMHLQAAQTLLLDAAAHWNGSPKTRDACYPSIVAAKQFATETAARVTDMALRIAGGAALTRDLPLERHFRDVRAGFMQPPSGDTAYEMIGRGAIDAYRHENG